MLRIPAAVGVAGAEGLEAGARQAAAAAKGELPRRLGPRVEVLVEPAVWRRIDGARTPADIHDFVAVAVLVRAQAELLGPQQHEPLGLQAEQDGAGPVVVG